MSYQKNDVLTVKIEDMGHDGEGIGKCEGYTLFVKDTVIGDLAEVKVIKAKKNYGYARLMRLIEPSAHRVEPVCPVARPCGGCQLQMLDYAEQLRFKEKKIAGNLQRIGGMTEIPMEPIVGMENPFRYRNKAQFPIGQDRNGKLITGFYAGRTHQIMENRNCYLGVEQNEEILNRILAWMEENGVPAYNEETGKGLVRHVLIRFGFMTKEIMVCLVVNGKKLPAEEKLIKSLTELEGMTSITLSANRERTNVIMGKEIVNLARNTEYDLILMDIEMETMNAGILATQEIREADPEAGIIFLTAHETREMIVTAMGAGALDYIVKGCEDEEILYHIRCALKGNPIMSNKIHETVMQEYARLQQSEKSLLFFINNIS